MSNDTQAVEGTVVVPWDREFNAAILHLGTKLLPRGFSVITPIGEYDPWTLFKENNRPVVPVEVTGQNVFADDEVERTFGALYLNAMFGGPTGAEHGGHAPALCPLMFVAGADALCAAIVVLYGDDDRTTRWRKFIYAWTLGRIGFSLVYDDVPSDSLRFVTSSLAAVDDLNAVETGVFFRQAYQGAIHQVMQRAEIQRAVDNLAADEDDAKPTVH